MDKHHSTLARLNERLRADLEELGTRAAARITKQSQTTISRFTRHTAEPIATTIDAVAHGLGYGFKMVRIRPAPTDPGTPQAKHARKNTPRRRPSPKRSPE